MPRSDQKKAAFILLGIFACEGLWLLWSVRLNPSGFLNFAGFSSLRAAGILGWTLALTVAVAYIAISITLPSVRANLFQPSVLKLLALGVAITAGLCEELIFRKLLMDGMERHGWDVTAQLGATALTFGLVHAIWGLFRGSLRAAVGAMVFTGVLGLALGIVYIASQRIVSPCVVSHFLINALVEPGLMLAAVRGEMSRSTP